MNVDIEKMDSQIRKGRASEGEFPLKPFKLNESDTRRAVDGDYIYRALASDR